jgi:hypothetical protein
MAYVVYRRDEEGVKEALVAGERHELVESEYGKNEYLVEFLRELGIWEVLCSLRPEVKKENGFSPHLLNGLLILFNLMHLGHLSRAGVVLRDGKLLTDLGFTVEQVKKAEQADRGVVHQDTLRNHLQRIEEKEAKRVFYEVVKLVRRKRLVRGKVYVADGFVVEVYGKTYEGAGRVWDRDEGRWVVGYKVVILLNVEEDRERIVGVAMGPVGTDERVLLCEILDDLTERVCPVRDMIELLILDRGYWGARFLSRLKEEYGIDYLTLVPSEVGLVEDVRGLSRLPEHKPQAAKVKKGGKKRPRTKELEVSGIPGVEYTSDGCTMRVNAVLTRHVDKETGEVHEWVYVTTLPLGRHPEKWIEKYGRRWTVENEGIRQLSQEWRVKTPVGRKFRAIWAQVVMLMVLYNGVKVWEMKRPKDVEELRQEMKRRGRQSYLLGHTLVVFVPRRRICATMTGLRYGELMAAMAERQGREQALARLKRLLEEGVSIEEAIERVKRNLN